MKDFKFFRGCVGIDLTNYEINLPTASFYHEPNTQFEIIPQTEYNRRRDMAAEADEALRRYNLLHQLRIRQNEYNSTSTNSVPFFTGVNSQTKIKPRLWTRIKMYFEEYFYIDPFGLSGILFFGGSLIALGVYILLKLL